MSSQRENVISELVTMLQAASSVAVASGVSSVFLCNNIEDMENIKEYKVSELPSIRIYICDEDISYKPDQRAFNRIFVEIYFYIIEWSKTTFTKEEKLLKEIRDIFGNNPTMTSKAVDISVKSIVKQKVAYPLINYKISGIISYEESIKNN